MPQRHRRFLRPRHGLLALALAVSLGGPHTLASAPDLVAPVPPSVEGAIPRRGPHRGLRHLGPPRPRLPGWGFIPHPRCHYD